VWEASRRIVGGQQKYEREGSEGAAKNGAQEPTRGEQKDSKRAAKRQEDEG
jgi:hypothetical protein